MSQTLYKGQMAHLDEIIAHNQGAVPVPRSQSFVSVDARRELCIVTCVDPRLTKFFPLALGIERGDAVIIRMPGASLVNGQGDGMRAIAAAIYINHAKEILVLGHSDCGTTRIDDAAITSEMLKRGVNPSTMPGGPRAFIGGLSDVSQGARATAAAIRAAPYLPNDVLVHAAVLDIDTGALEIIERGEPFIQSASPVGGGALDYQGGRAGALGSSLGDGLGHLSSSPVGALYEGTSALASSKDPFASIAAQGLPPGWSDGSRALASQGGDAIAAVQAGAPVELAAPQAAPPPTPKATSKSSPKGKGSPRPGPAGTGAANANIGKVRDFYRLEFTLDQRKSVAKQLAAGAKSGMPAAELTKLVIKPILDLGQKRYRVIDEVIAIKEQASQLPPDDALALLAQLFE